MSLHDQLVPLDRESMRRLQWQDEVVRTSEHDQAHLGVGKQTEWLNRYPANPAGAQEHPVSFLEEVFYGEDITRGIALSVIRELNRIGGAFREHALHLTAQDDLRALLSRLYRVEAKLPSSFKLGEAEIRHVHNPMGDGRYLSSGIMHPEGMAAGAAYDAAKRHMTTIHSVLAGIDRPGTLQRRAKEIKKLLSFLKDHIKLRSEAVRLTEIFLTRATQEALSKEATDEDRERRDIADRELKSRIEDLQEAEGLMKTWDERLINVQEAIDTQERNARRDRKQELETRLELAKLAEREDGSGNDPWAEINEYLSSEEARELTRLRLEFPD